MPTGGRRTALVRPARSHPPRTPLVHQDHQLPPRNFSAGDSLPIQEEKNTPSKSSLIRVTTSTTSCDFLTSGVPARNVPFSSTASMIWNVSPLIPRVPGSAFVRSPPPVCPASSLVSPGPLSSGAPHLSAPRPALEADLLHSVWKRPCIGRNAGRPPPPRRRQPAPANCTTSRVLRSLFVILEAAPCAANERRTRCSGRGRRLRSAVRRFGGRSKRRLSRAAPAGASTAPPDGGGLGGASCT